MRKNAFTLIELLVVIAIIAILAAILFPVFAQAKVAAQKTSSLSGIKQVGTATQIYIADYNDQFPIATVYVFGTAPQNLLAWPYPAGWNPNFNGGDPAILDAEGVYWINALSQYKRNTEITGTAGIADFTLSSDAAVANPLAALGRSGVTYNSLVQQLSSSQIDNPSLVPVITTGNGRINVMGRGLHQPAMQCFGGTSPSSCRFNPGGSTAYNFTTWTWGFGEGPVQAADVYSNQILVSRADTSTRSFRISNNTENPNTNILEPWSTYDAQGAPVGIRLCNTTPDLVTSDWHPCFFRPDQDGTRTKWTGILE